MNVRWSRVLRGAAVPLVAAAASVLLSPHGTTAAGFNAWVWYPGSECSRTFSSNSWSEAYYWEGAIANRDSNSWMSVTCPVNKAENSDSVSTEVFVHDYHTTDDPSCRLRACWPTLENGSTNCWKSGAALSANSGECGDNCAPIVVTNNAYFGKYKDLVSIRCHLHEWEDQGQYFTESKVTSYHVDFDT